VHARATHKLLDYINGSVRLVRMTNLVIIVVTQYFTRILLIGPPQEWKAIIADPTMFLLSVSTVCIAAAGYIINDYFDIKIDIVNKPDRVVVGRYLKRRWAMGAHQVLNILGAIIGLFVSHWIFLINILSITLLWFYSERYKRLPFIGNFIVAALTGLTLLMLTVLFPANRELVFIYAIFSFFISMIREIVKDMEDMKGDAAHGCRTIPIIWGIAKTKKILYVWIVLLIMTMFVMASSLKNPTLLLLFVILLIPIGILTYVLYRSDTRRDYKKLSSLCKLIMLLGLLTMIWA
jgi:4-hydroxybenzoate polyprenyltransferase